MKAISSGGGQIAREFVCLAAGLGLGGQERGNGLGGVAGSDSMPWATHQARKILSDAA